MFKNINLLALSLLSATSLAAPTPAPQSGTGVNDPNYSWSVTGWSAGCARSGCYYGKFTSPQDPPPTPNHRPRSQRTTSNTYQTSTSQLQHTTTSPHSQHTAPVVQKAPPSSPVVSSMTCQETAVLQLICWRLRQGLVRILRLACSGRIWSRREYPQFPLIHFLGMVLWYGFVVWFCGMVLWYGFVLVESWKRMGVFRKRILADRKQEHVLQLHG